MAATTESIPDFAKGAKVRYRAPEIRGEVVRKDYDDKTDTFRYLVAYTDAAGEPQRRYFSRQELMPDTEA
jgi:hypothetical protein